METNSDPSSLLFCNENLETNPEHSAYTELLEAACGTNRKFVVSFLKFMYLIWLVKVTGTRSPAHLCSKFICIRFLNTPDYKISPL